jgi:hypothetical protein
MYLLVSVRCYTTQRRILHDRALTAYKAVSIGARQLLRCAIDWRRSSHNIHDTEHGFVRDATLGW